MNAERELMVADFLEVTLKKPEDFLRVKETLTRIGLTAKNSKTLIQSCYILHKQGKYYICGFGELFKLDGKESSVELEDIQRRNRIACLLKDWGLIEIKDPEKFTDMIPLNRIKIIPHREKHEWVLKSNYTVGHTVH